VPTQSCCSGALALSEFSADSSVPASLAQSIHKATGLSIDLMTSEPLRTNPITRYLFTHTPRRRDRKASSAVCEHSLPRINFLLPNTPRVCLRCADADGDQFAWPVWSILPDATSCVGGAGSPAKRAVA
jgi:hypothetical protein